MTAVGILGFVACKKPIASPPPAWIPDKLSLDSCDDARRKPDWITWDDGRWVNCALPPSSSKAEAFTLGEPVYAPLGPPAQESHLFTAGNCDHAGRSITEHNLWYKPEDIGVAIACSRQ